VYHMQQSVAKMESQDYQNSITAHLSAQEAMTKISQVPKWWAKDFEGKSENPSDVFTIRFKSGDMYKLKVSEIIPDKKIVWEVIDSYQGWHKNHTEWTGTKIVWEIFSLNDGTEVKMTHVGLVPEFECFAACNRGWNYLIKESLQKLLDADKGMPV